MKDQITAEEWFSSGSRVIYDPVTNKIVERAENANVAGEIHVWKRVERNAARNNQESWTTFLPGFPDGSFGWAKVDQQLNQNSMLPKLYVEYVGQGDSDKPSRYSYGTMERADLVEATWEAEGRMRRSGFVRNSYVRHLAGRKHLPIVELKPAA